jgi:putative tryptophan/tyrosine transport system substrate-binding protein
LRETVAGIRRIALLVNMENPAVPSQWEEFKTAAPLLGFEAQLLDVRKPEDIARAFDTAIAQRADAIFVQNDTVTLTNRRQLVELAAKHRLPAMYNNREWIDAGGLIAYGVSYPDLYRRAAIFVDKIFKGATPADLPVEQPTKFELVINLKTARALGLDMPPPLLARADAVFFRRRNDLANSARRSPGQRVPLRGSRVRVSQEFVPPPHPSRAACPHRVREGCCCG